MADQYKENASELGHGVHLDNDPINQPKGTRRFTLNAIEETVDGEQNFVSNEKAYYACTHRPAGFELIGDRYIEDDLSVVILVNPITDKQEIGLLSKDNNYQTIVNTGVLGLKITNQCDIIYRLRRGKERVIYWVDALNFARTFNLDRPQNFYTAAYQAYLKAGGNPLTYVGDKWDGPSFDLIKSYSSVPFFSNIELLEYGSILPGSYNFAIQYIDEDLNPTAWVTTSNPVNIYNDTTNIPYGRIRGSRNVDSASQSFPRANKSIKLTITNLDNSFPYYRVAIIRAAGNTGEPEKVLASELYSTSDSNFIYSGNDQNLTEVQLGDILIDHEVIFAPKHIEQLENRLILANTKGKNINWCNFQKSASKIKSDLTTKQVLLNNIQSEPNVKHAKSTFFYRGYMPGEVYSFGICYLFKDGFVSPAFHIPGKNILNTTSLMKYHEIDDRYLDVHNCITNYWGLDATGQTLSGKKKRHHRFPFRKDVNKPLVSSTGTTTNLTKYRLKLTFTLNPAYTPTPNTYPVDSGGNPIVIPFVFNYQVLSLPSTDSFNGYLVDTDITNGTQIVIYNDVNPLTPISGVDYFLLDPTSQLATYQVAGNERFLVTQTYENYVVSSSFNDDQAEIFGIDFSNIEKPHPDVVGFYIVRNERTDDDRLIVDNAVFGAMTEFQQYKSFGLLMPKQYYNVDNCGRQGNPNKTLNYFKKGLWFFSPEFEYFQKKTEYDEIVVEGTYNQTSVNMPTISNVDGSTCNGGQKPNIPFYIATTGGSRGVYINDVQAGTSYDPTINKKKTKDDDGFDLIIGYRNTNVGFTINNTGISLPIKKRIIYLNAASYQNFESNTYYNVSVDNKIGMYLTLDDVDLTKVHNDSTNASALLYGSLVRNSTTSYSNFVNRSYYKEHNNPVMFGINNIVNDVKIFNGDAEISGMNLVSSVYYDMVVADRAKKSGLWKIIAGAVLVIAAIIVSVATAGAGAPLAMAVTIGTLSSLAISLGVSLAMSGIKFEQFKSMIDVDYEQGLKDTVTDGGVFETVRDTIEREDDTIRWFADRVSNIYIESAVPFGLRSGLTSGVSDFMDGPGVYDEAGFRTYLTEKLTAIDRNQGSGRIYKGYATAEVYDMNRDYMRFNKEKVFIHLPLEYDCCSDDTESFPLRRWFSEQSFQEEKTDNYRVFLPNNYSDMEGEHGEITDLYRLGSNLFCQTREALWQQPANLQERVTNEIVSFIGTGSFLAIPPRKIVDDNLGSAGTQHKWATIKTKYGVISLSEVEHRIHLHGASVEAISNKGLTNYFKENLRSFLSKQLYDNFGVNFLNENNPANPNGIGYLSTYDTRFDRIIITKRDYLIVADRLKELMVTTLIPTSTVPIFYYCTVNGFFYLGTTVINLNNPDYFENKSWTISYSFREGNKSSWTSWHSYFPNYYIHSQNNMYHAVAGDTAIYKHHKIDQFLIPHIIEYVISSSPLVDKIMEDLTIQTEARKWDTVAGQFIDQRYITFNKITAYNTRQNTGETILAIKETQDNPNFYLGQQVANIANSIPISRNGRNWNINEFRDYVVDYTKPMFLSDWNSIKANYYTDKVINPTAIDSGKHWSELESFKDKFIVIRLKFDNFTDINLITNYSIESEQSTIEK